MRVLVEEGFEEYWKEGLLVIMKIKCKVLVRKELSVEGIEKKWLGVVLVSNEVIVRCYNIKVIYFIFLVDVVKGWLLCEIYWGCIEIFY